MIAARAGRDLYMASFYEKNEFVAAARYYYAEVLKNYPNTPMARGASQRLAALQGQPDGPPQRFAWISSAFPSDKKPPLRLAPAGAKADEAGLRLEVDVATSQHPTANLLHQGSDVGR